MVLHLLFGNKPYYKLSFLLTTESLNHEREPEISVLSAKLLTVVKLSNVPTACSFTASVSVINSVKPFRFLFHLGQGWQKVYWA